MIRVTPPATGVRRMLSALLVLATSVTAAVVLAPAASASPAGTLPVTVSLTGVSSVALTPDTVLTVNGTLRNTGRTAFTALQVVLRLDWRVLTDRRELAEWAQLDPKDPANGTKQNGLVLAKPLAPGQTAGFSITMRGDSVQLPVDADGFGPRKMAVEIQNGHAASGTRVGILRTFTVWNPVQEYSPIRLAMLVPVTAGHQPVDQTAKADRTPRSGNRAGD